MKYKRLLQYLVLVVGINPPCFLSAQEIVVTAPEPPKVELPPQAPKSGFKAPTPGSVPKVVVSNATQLMAYLTPTSSLGILSTYAALSQFIPEKPNATETEKQQREDLLLDLANYCRNRTLRNKAALQSSDSLRNLQLELYAYVNQEKDIFVNPTRTAADGTVQLPPNGSPADIIVSANRTLMAAKGFEIVEDKNRPPPFPVSTDIVVIGKSLKATDERLTEACKSTDATCIKPGPPTLGACK